MRSAPFVLVAATMLLAACGGSGQRDIPPWLRPAEKPRNESFRGGPAAMLLRFDANHDGIVTRQEMEAGVKAEFEAADTNHTGCLTMKQADAINQKRQDEDRSTATPLIDWNHDGCIDYREFSAAPYSLFDQLDRNNDGKLTPKELGQQPQKADGTDQPDAEGSTGEPTGNQHPGPHRDGGRRGAPPGTPTGGEGPGGPLPAVPD